MRSVAVVLALLGAVPAGVLAQQSPPPAARQPTDLPCKLKDYRIGRSGRNQSPDTVAVLWCDGLQLADFAATAVLSEIAAGKAPSGMRGDSTEPSVQTVVDTVTVQGPAAMSGNWLILRFTHGLQGGEDYDLALSGTYAKLTSPSVTEHFSAGLRLSTRPELTVAKAHSGDAAILTGHIEMQVSDKAKMTDAINNREYTLLAPPVNSNGIDYDSMGQIPIVHSPHLGALGSVLKLEGVTDAFGQVAQVVQEGKQPADLPCKLTDYRVLHAQNPPDTVAALCFGPGLPILQLLPGFS
jgi:hypothetical protein